MNNKDKIEFEKLVKKLYKLMKEIDYYQNK